MYRIFAFCCLLLCYGLLEAGVYRWVDDNGAIHYGDKPPAGTTTTKVDIDPGSAGQPQGLREGERQRLHDVGARREQAQEARQQQRQVLQDQDAERRQRCAKAETHYSALREQRRLGYQAEVADDLREQLSQAKQERQRYCR